MTEERAQRRLAAILAADVVGYSRLMAADEAGTLLALHTWQREILNPVVGSYGGRIVKLMGDGVLAEFASAVNAVECALALQKATQVPNEAVPAERRMTLRIGINLGDVLVKDDDLYGDGVNLAARIEGATEAGTVGLSQAVFDQVRGKVEADFEDTGEHDLKNIARPVRIYRAVAASRLEQTKHLAPAASDRGVASVAPRPAIAVLPLTSMSAEPGQRFLADGITEDIITELSRFTALTVIARNSSARFADRPADVKQAGRQLGARYLVEGSLRGLGDKVRITVQLIDVESAGHLWAERFDRATADAAAIDKAVQAIVRGIANRVAESEEEQVRKGPEASRTAYHFMLRARELMQDGDYLACEVPLRRAIELDPALSEAYGLLVHALIQKYLYGDNDGDLAEAERSARQAIALNPRGSGPQFGLAYVAMTQGNHDLAGLHLDRAIALNPNNINAHLGRTQWLLWGGQAEQALVALEASIEREELAPSYYWEIRAEILYQLHRYRESLEAIARINRAHFWIKALAIAALAQTERLDEARRMLAALHTAQPNMTIARVMRANVYKDGPLREHLIDGLRKAGMPA